MTDKLINDLKWHAAAMSNAVEHVGPDQEGAELMRKAATALEEAKRLREALEKAKFTYDEWWKDDHYEAIVPLRAVSKIIDAALLPPEETP